MFIQKTNTELKCDNPECTISYKWQEEEVITDENALPDPAYRFLILAIPFGKEKWTFCSKYCLMEFLKSLAPKKSPREQRLEAEKKAAEISEIEKMVSEGSPT